MRTNALTFAFVVLALTAGQARAQLENPLTSQPLEGLQEKGNIVIDAIQGENAELAGAAYRLQTIAFANATVPEKLSTLASQTRSSFDAAWARVRSLGLKPQQTAAIYADLLNQFKCVQTPAQWVEAFKKNSFTCVSEDLVGRLANSDVNVDETRNRLLSGTASKAANFWSGADALAKYLRVSFPLSLGDNIPQFNNSYFNQTYNSSNFAGLRQFRNGQALVNNIGFGAPDWSSTNSYVVGVYSKAAIRAAMRSDNEFYQQFNLTATTAGIRPLWPNIKNMFEITYQAYDLQIPQVAIDLISNTTFADLTGCGAQCSWAPSNKAPSSCLPDLVYIGVRINDTDTDCGLPLKPRTFNETVCGPYNATVWTSVPPTLIEPNQFPCSADWKRYNDLLGNATKAANLTDAEARTLAGSVAVMKEYKELLATDAKTDLQKALLTRNFFLQGTQGTFNPLFAGNGYTATGVGGVFMATSSEFLFSPFNSSLLQPGKGFDTVAFCLNGYPPSADGKCTQLTPAKP